MRFELHAHTTASDGLLTPSALVEHALASEVTTLAVTDHDTLRGIPEAAARGRELGVEIIPGIEATCEAVVLGESSTSTSTSTSTNRLRRIEVHILGHFVDAASKELAQTFARLRARRIERMHEMIGKLAALGVHVDAAAIMKIEAASFGRPHLARALVAAGAVASVDEAFRKYLAEGRPAFAEKTLLPSAEAIAAIRAAGGVATLAHPGRYKEPADLDRLKAEGLGGLEVYYPTHTPIQQEAWLAEATRLGLVASGGGDFHGDPGRKPPIGQQPVPEGVVGELRRAAGRG